MFHDFVHNKIDYVRRKLKSLRFIYHFSKNSLFSVLFYLSIIFYNIVTMFTKYLLLRADYFTRFPCYCTLLIYF